MAKGNATGVGLGQFVGRNLREQAVLGFVLVSNVSSVASSGDLILAKPMHGARANSSRES
jgi:hypothetical protein